MIRVQRTTFVFTCVLAGATLIACGDDSDPASSTFEPDSGAMMAEDDDESSPATPGPAEPTPTDDDDPVEETPEVPGPTTPVEDPEDPVEEPETPVEEPVEEVPLGNIVEVAQAAGSFDTLLAAAEAAGLVEALTGEGPLTVFAPTDDAFDALPEGTVEALLEDPEELAAVLQYHVVAGAVAAADLSDGDEVDTLLGPWLDVAIDGSSVTVGTANVVSRDVAASNGVIHVIDSVLLPPAALASLAAATPELSTLSTAIEVAGLTETLEAEGPFTVFAPTDAAFEALPEDVLEGLLEDSAALENVLLHHVVEGRQKASAVVAATSFTTLQGGELEVVVEDGVVTLNGAEVVITDVQARNGVVHVIDSVLVPAAEEEVEPMPGTLPEELAADGSFTTLLTAVEVAGLGETLSGEGPFTLFAPTDAAFEALPEGALQALLDDPEELAQVLTYHVVSGAVPAADVVEASSLDTVLGPWLDVVVSEGVVTIAGAQVTVTDIAASNGIIHVIDAVLLPPPSIAGIAAADPTFSTLVAALEAADLVTTLDGPGPFTVFAPTNAAFDALPEGTLEALLDDIPALTSILLYHVVSGQQRASSVVAASELTSVSDAVIEVVVDGDTVTVAGAPIRVVDIAARNGVIHVIDAVMLPPAE